MIKYSVPEYTVVTAMRVTTVQITAVFSGKTIRTQRPTMVLAVFILPLHPAAITLPLAAATIRNPETANSRVLDYLL